MKKTFLKYFGFSIEKKKAENARELGFRIVQDEIVFIGLIFNMLNYVVGFWLHKKDYIISARKS